MYTGDRTSTTHVVTLPETMKLGSISCSQPSIRGMKTGGKHGIPQDRNAMSNMDTIEYSYKSNKKERMQRI